MAGNHALGALRPLHYVANGPRSHHATIYTDTGLDVARMVPLYAAPTIVESVNIARDLYDALEAQEAYDNHAHECEPCQSGWHCVVGADLSTKAQDLRVKAFAKARGEA